MKNERPKLKARQAAELIKGMGGGEVVVTVHDRGEVTIVAISGGNILRAQNQAEALLGDVKRKYEIVRD